jgi:S-adenosyl-L-methionine hydrolase (adenosine-forming)
MRFLYETDFMAIITLTSDWGFRDHYIAAVKGRILSLMPDVTIVDISHAINMFDDNHAAFVVKHAFQSFPAGTVHIIGVNSIAGIDTPHTVVKHKGHFFIGADNGILTLICEQNAEEIVEIDIASDTDYFTFPSRDVFPKVAASILAGKPLAQLGTSKKMLKELVQFVPVMTSERLTGKIIHFDQYSNAITNIHEAMFRSFVKGRPFVISMKSHPEGITHISQSYDDVPEGEKLALFGTTGHLQIALNRGTGMELLGLRHDDNVMVTLSE